MQNTFFNTTNFKQILKKLLPPILFDVRIALLQYFTSQPIGERPFVSWWESNKYSSGIPSSLREMTDYFLQTNDSKRMSKYWWYLARQNIEQIQKYGYDNFKQTVARNYYTWVGEHGLLLMSEVFQGMEHAPAANRDSSIQIGELFKIHKYFSTKESIDFNLNTVLFYQYVESTGGGLLIEEPSEGNPPGMHINNKLVTQDLLNSLLDYKAISNSFNLESMTCILELGAGYGRTAFYILKMVPHLAYIVVDIPPALYVSQRYLTGQFPHKQVLTFKKDLNKSDLKKAVEQKALIFLTPDQLELVEDRGVDLFVAIDNLHAMTPQQVQHYFDQVDRLAENFYFTYWPGMEMPFDQYTHTKWPIKPHWELLDERKTTIPSCYVNAAYRIN